MMSVAGSNLLSWYYTTHNPQQSVLVVTGTGSVCAYSSSVTHATAMLSIPNVYCVSVHQHASDILQQYQYAILRYISKSLYVWLVIYLTIVMLLPVN